MYTQKELEYLDRSGQLLPSQGRGGRGEVRAPLPVGRRVLGELRPTLEGHYVGVPHASLAVLQLILHTTDIAGG